MVVEPQAEGVLGDALNEIRRFARGQAFFRLARELRVAQLERQDVTRLAPDILGREFDAARQQVSKLAELAHGVGESGAEAVDVGAVLHRRDEVDVTLHEQLAAFGQPHHRPMHLAVGSRHMAEKRLLRHPFEALDLAQEIVLKTVLVVPLLVVLGVGLVLEGNVQARAQHRLGAQHALERRYMDFGRIEELRVRPEMHRGAGVFAVHFSQRA